MKIAIRVGCSGWSYDEWVGAFYTSPDRKLSQYVKVFDMAEIDSTFYKVPPPTVARAMVSASPPNFYFLPKFNRSITHEKMLGLKGNVEEDLEKFLLFLRPIASSGKLGPALIQLPPYFSFEHSSNLYDFLQALPKWVKPAVEFRNISLIRSEVILKLSDFNAAYVAVDEPLLPPYNFITSDISYIRFHGKGHRVWFDYHYSDEELKPWVEEVKSIQSINAYVLFNNHFHGYAVENALSFLTMLGIANQDQTNALKRFKSSIL
ncbi:MAG: DUF72 domain-containing protein [Thermoprotei archaeon]